MCLNFAREEEIVLKNMLMAIVALALSGSAIAQEVAPARIVVVDFDRVSRESLVGKDISAQMESNRVALEQKVSNTQKSLTNEQEEIAKQRNIISQEAFQERARAFEQKAQQMQAELQNLQNQARQAMQQANLEVQRALRPVVRSLREAKGANIVLDKALVSDHAPGLDITTEVIEGLDKALPAFQVSLPEIAVN